jgi:hypothetical protein
MSDSKHQSPEVSIPAVPRAAHDDADLELFVALSSVLTGFPESTLAPSLDPVRLKNIYFDTLRVKADPATLSQLLAVFKGIHDALPVVRWPDAVHDQILLNNELGPLARQIIKLWLLGVYFSPPDQSVTGEVVSSMAFTHGLLWTAIRAHPTGYSVFPHGYWASPPPDSSSETESSNKP